MLRSATAGPPPTLAAYQDYLQDVTRRVSPTFLDWTNVGTGYGLTTGGTVTTATAPVGAMTYTLAELGVG